MGLRPSSGDCCEELVHFGRSPNSYARISCSSFIFSLDRAVETETCGYVYIESGKGCFSWIFAGHRYQCSLFIFFSLKKYLNFGLVCWWLLNC